MTRGPVFVFLLGGLGETLASVRRVALATDGGAGPAVGGGGDVCSQGRQGTFPSSVQVEDGLHQGVITPLWDHSRQGAGCRVHPLSPDAGGRGCCTATAEVHLACCVGVLSRRWSRGVGVRLLRSPGRWNTSALVRKMKAVAKVASLILAMVTSRASIWIKARPVVLKSSIVLLVWPSETSRPPLYRPCSS